MSKPKMYRQIRFFESALVAVFWFSVPMDQPAAAVDTMPTRLRSTINHQVELEAKYSEKTLRISGSKLIRDVTEIPDYDTVMSGGKSSTLPDRVSEVEFSVQHDADEKRWFMSSNMCCLSGGYDPHVAAYDGRYVRALTRPEGQQMSYTIDCNSEKAGGYCPLENLALMFVGRRLHMQQQPVEVAMTTWEFLQQRNVQINSLYLPELGKTVAVSQSTHHPPVPGDPNVDGWDEVVNYYFDAGSVPRLLKISRELSGLCFWCMYTVEYEYADSEAWLPTGINELSIAKEPEYNSELGIMRPDETAKLQYANSISDLKWEIVDDVDPAVYTIPRPTGENVSFNDACGDQPILLEPSWSWSEVFRWIAYGLIFVAILQLMRQMRRGVPA